jgi:cytochrome c
MDAMLRTAKLAALGLVAALAAPAAAQDKSGSDKGELLYNNACRTCHSWNAGDNRLGPHLNKIVGRKAGAAEGFGYSEAMKNSGITWDEATLDKFIANPDQVVAGNNMKPYSGMTSAEDRKAIIEFMANGKPAQ